MKNFFTYLTSSQDDKNWGIYLTVVGKYTAHPGEPYPKKDHPSGYYFEWENGRVLDEYQLNYITEGYGVFESRGQEFEVTPGSLIILKPGIKHRYKPKEQSGWTEHYIGVKGKLSTQLIEQVFGNTHPIIHCGSQIVFLDCYQKIFNLVKDQKPAYQQITSGLVIKLLGHISSFLKSEKLEGEVDTLINDAKNLMWKNVSTSVDFHEFAKTRQVSYSYFRKVFKLYTGIAPHQFYLDLKIMRAKELVIATDKSIKEITYELGFDNIHYFSRMFKNKTGSAPTDLRKQLDEV